jgi:hypothetical protein
LTRLRTGRSVVRIPAEFRLALGPFQPSVQCDPRVISQRVKRPGRDVYHLSPSSAEVKNEWSCTSTPTMYLHGVHRASLTCIFTVTYGWVRSDKGSAENVIKLWPVSGNRSPSYFYSSQACLFFRHSEVFALRCQAFSFFEVTCNIHPRILFYNLSTYNVTKVPALFLLLCTYPAYRLITVHYVSTYAQINAVNLY